MTVSELTAKVAMQLILRASNAGRTKTRCLARGARRLNPVFLNSPMAIDMTEICHRHRTEYQLSIEEYSGLCNVARMVRSVQASRGVYLNHGEPGSADALRQRIERERGWSVTVPCLGQMIGIQP